MKHILLILLIIFQQTIIFGQSNGKPDKKAKAIEEIRQLIKNLNDAAQHHDRQALGKIYADEFVFMHGFGYIDNKTAQINGIMESDSMPVIAVPSFEQFFLYGDVAVLRVMNRNPVGGNNLASTTIYAKKDGLWQIIQVQSTQQQRERNTIKLSPTVLDSYPGKYIQGSSNTMITRSNDTLFAQRTGRPRLPLSAVADNQFYDKFGSSLTFYKNDKGEITHFIWKGQNGQELTWKKEF